MHYCAKEDLADCLVEILTCHGMRAAHVVTSSLKQTPLHIACAAGAVTAARLLARYDCESLVMTTTMLPLATHADAMRVVRTKSTARVALVHRKDSSGKYPVQLAPRSFDAQCLESLWTACFTGNSKL